MEITMQRDFYIYELLAHGARRAYHIENIREGMAATGKTEAQLSEMVGAIAKVAKLEDVKQFHFRELFKWATDGQGTISTPKPQAVATQSALPLRAAPAPIEMRIGNKSIQFQPKDMSTQTCAV